MKEIRRVIINNFDEYIRIANKRMPKPFKKDSKVKLPMKYRTEEFEWSKEGKLIYKETGKIVPANSMTVGRPRDWRINGQDVYNQKVKHSARNAISQKMHDKFRKDLKQLGKIEDEFYPLSLRIEFYFLDRQKQYGKSKNIDNDNLWIYEKVIQDTMKELGIIPDDNPYYINENSKKTIFVDNKEDVRVEIVLYSNN